MSASDAEVAIKELMRDPEYWKGSPSLAKKMLELQAAKAGVSLPS